MGVDTIAPLDSKNDIMQELVRFLALVEGKTAQIAPMEKVLAASRRSRTRELSNLLDRVVQES
jgi:hypothetical protein